MVGKENLLVSAKTYLGGSNPRAPLAAPLYADLRGLPPMLIQVGDAEVLLDDSTRLAGIAREAGVEVEMDVWDDMIHVWHLFAPILPEGKQAISQAGNSSRTYRRLKMIYDFRMYTLKPGATPDYRAGVKEVGLPIRQNHDVALSGWYWSDIGALNQVVHIWGYKDLEHLNSQKAAVYADPTGAGSMFPGPSRWSNRRRRG